MKILQNFVAFSEYMNFMNLERNSLSHNSIGCWTKGICYLMLNKGMLDLVRANFQPFAQPNTNQGTCMIINLGI